MDTLKTLEKRYLRTLLMGDSEAAWDVLLAGIEQGWNLFHLYLHVLAPTQIEIGEMWHRRDINVAQEHLASEITERLMDTLSRHFSSHRQLHRYAVLSTVEQEAHQLGVKMVADFLRVEGWNVKYLGSNVPGYALADYAYSRNADLVGLSITMKSHFEQALATIQALRKRAPRLKVLVGGRALNLHPELVDLLEADGYAKDAQGAIREVRRLFPLTEPNASLQYHLLLLGRRLSSRRKELGFSQKIVAEKAELDRTYISGVERGKQNVTFGALSRISAALDMSLYELFDESWSTELLQQMGGLEAQ
jgi:methanogenic corrinoid protein MtbC1/DNA-binding XRE family transcriptional regulator